MRGRHLRLLSCAAALALATGRRVSTAPRAASGRGGASGLEAGGPPSRPAWDAAATASVRSSAERILACVHPDGAINTYPRKTGNVWICPYFANLACWGLTKAYAVTGEDRFRSAARDWLAWYRDHINADGTVHDYKGGTCPNYHDSGEYDAADSYAATYACAVWRYWRATGDDGFLREFYPHVLRALKAVEELRQPDGLTWAKRDYKMKYAGDNVEVRIGLLATARMAEVCDPTRVEYYTTWADQIEKALLGGLWDQDLEWFRVAPRTTDASKAYPGGFANLWQIIFLLDPSDDATRALLTKVSAWTFPTPGKSKPPQAGLYLWYALAAQQVGDKAMAETALRAFRDRDNERIRPCHDDSWLVFLQALAHEPDFAWAPGSRRVRLPRAVSLEPARRQLRRHLQQQILPLWTAPEIEDRAPGGFLNRLDAGGKPAGQTAKPLIAHLRLLWVHAVTIQRTDDPEDRQRLRARYERQRKFLVERFRDAGSGDWRPELTRAGRPTDAPKRMVDQVYALYILAELAQRLDDATALAWAEKTFDMLERRGWDPEFGGYRVALGVAPGHKDNRIRDVGVNFHALLALTRLVQASPKPLHRQRLAELYGIVTTRFMDPETGHGHLVMTRDWRPLLAPPRGSDKTLHGHNVEMLWYALEAARVLGRDPAGLLPWLLKGAEALVRDGMAPCGAVYCLGKLSGEVADPDIHFWAQAETMILFLRLYELTGDERWRNLFEDVRRWTFACMVGPVTGLWRLRMNGAGQELEGGFAGAQWKAGLHVVRMLLQAEAVCERIKNRRP